MRILVTGAGGFIGSSLIPFLESHGHEIWTLSRRGMGRNRIEWDPSLGKLDLSAVPHLDAVVHLAGESLVGRWTKAKIKRIRDSRILGTRLLVERLRDVGNLPSVHIQASGVGYYGASSETPVNEQSPNGNDFLGTLSREWEAESLPLQSAGCRVVWLRLGAVLGPGGGMLGAMLPAFKFGLGGRLGNGLQVISWIAIQDVLSAIGWLLTAETVSGPINMVSPNPVTNSEFTRELGRALKRPTPFPVPAWSLRLLFGEMADNLMLGSHRVTPGILLEENFPFEVRELGRDFRLILEYRRLGGNPAPPRN